MYIDASDLTNSSTIIRWLQTMDSFQGSGNITGYNVYQNNPDNSKSPFFSYTLLSNITFCQLFPCEVQIYIPELSSNTIYSFSFSAINYVGESPTSQAFQFTTMTSKIKVTSYMQVETQSIFISNHTT